MSASTYTVYRMALPSGGVVRVRKPGIIGLLGRAPSMLPLLAAALEVSRPSDTETTKSESAPRTVIQTLQDFARSVLLEPDLADVLLWADLLAIHRWGLSPEVTPARLESEAKWGANDLRPLIKGHGSILLDRIASRYGQRPSTLLGLTDNLALAADCDLAVGYRGLRYENNGDEVEVEDMTGRKWRVPKSALATANQPAGAHVINADWYTDRYGELNLTAGGEGGDGQISIEPVKH